MRYLKWLTKAYFVLGLIALDAYFVAFVFPAALIKGTSSFYLTMAMISGSIGIVGMLLLPWIAIGVEITWLAVWLTQSFNRWDIKVSDRSPIETAMDFIAAMILVLGTIELNFLLLADYFKWNGGIDLLLIRSMTILSYLAMGWQIVRPLVILESRRQNRKLNRESITSTGLDF